MVIRRVLVLFILQYYCSAQAPRVTKVAVEGVSRNVDILCDLDRQIRPLYWEIQGEVYDLYSVPALFTVQGHEAITIRGVDRRMDEWRFQCFNINQLGLNLGQITVLSVLFDSRTEGPTDDPEILKPSIQGQLTLHYQKLQVGPRNTTFGWLYSPHPTTPCAVSSYRVNVYTEEDINQANLDEGFLESIQNFETTSRELTISSQYLLGVGGSAHFFRLTAEQEANNVCAMSAYYHKLRFNGTTTDIHTSGNSSFFEIPDELQNDVSLQLIWSKDNVSQCVCPPVEEIMSKCACNVNYSPDKNMITVSNNTITVSNLPHEMGEGKVILNFVSSVSSGCHNTCNLRSIVKIYRIIITQGYPEPPTINFNNETTFSFTIPDNPISSEVYDVNLTDSTGSQTRLSGVYNTSSVLSITSDLYPDVCAPFQLSVTAVNSVGREAIQHIIGAMTEPTPCECYKQKETLDFNVSVSATSAELTLSCRNENGALMVAFEVMETGTSSFVGHNIMLQCNSMKLLEPLMASTNYTVTGLLPNQQVPCIFYQFTTDPVIVESKDTSKTVIAVVVSVIGTIILLAICVAVPVIFKWWHSKRSKKSYTLKHSPTTENLVKGSSAKEEEDVEKNEDDNAGAPLCHAE